MQKRVRRSEAVDMLIPRLMELRAAKPNAEPVFVAVVGGSASGKGHLISELLERLNGPGAPPDHAAVLALDNYYLGAKERSALGAPHFDHPSALDLAEASAHLARMRVGKTIEIPRYDFSVGERAGRERFTAKRFVLVDGLFALYAPEIRALLDEAVFIDSDVDSTMLRRLFRDHGPGGRTKQPSSEVLEQFFTQVQPAKREFIDPTARYAGFVVESTYDPAAEAGRAGPMQYQLKARCDRLGDDAVTYLAKAERLGAQVMQIDRFMKPRGRDNRGELLRFRFENASVFLTYKGPFQASRDGVGARSVTSPIELPPSSLRWFLDDYETLATLEKRRVLYQAGGALIARDCVKGLGNYVEVRTNDESQVPKLRKLLSALCPGAEALTGSYLDLWIASRTGVAAVP